MTCREADPLLNAYFDGELDLAGSLTVEHHLAECNACSNLYRNFARVREEIGNANLDFSADIDVTRLRAAIRGRMNDSTPRPKTSQMRWIPAIAAAALLAVMIPSFVGMRGDHTDRQILDSHMRSLMENHLIDVESSDHHTVKPWFQGKLDFSPPVPDLEAKGFPLAGGRLDVISGRPAAAVVYKRRSHIINLWIVRAGDTAGTPEEKELDGYHLLRWRSGNFDYWAISDLNMTDLRTFAGAIRADAPPAR